MAKPQLVAIGGGMHNDDIQAKELLRIERKRIAEKKWYAANSEKKKKYALEYYQKNRESRIEFSIEYRKRRPEVTLASQLRKYGLTIESYQSLLSSQNNQCKICGVVFNKESKSTEANVDHCHKTGMVRGILCGCCNKSLGHIEKDGFLEKALVYLGDK